MHTGGHGGAVFIHLQAAAGNGNGWDPLMLTSLINDTTCALPPVFSRQEGWSSNCEYSYLGWLWSCHEKKKPTWFTMSSHHVKFDLEMAFYIFPSLVKWIIVANRNVCLQTPILKLFEHNYFFVLLNIL